MEHRVANRDILAIGTSAGGFEALRFLASEFPHDFPCFRSCGHPPFQPIDAR